MTAGRKAKDTHQCSTRAHDRDDLVDDIIEALSSILEYAGILPSSENDCRVSNGSGVVIDPWSGLSNSLKQLILSAGKLERAMSSDFRDGFAVDLHTFITTNEILLSMEDTIHTAKQHVESISVALPKNSSVQLNMCRVLGSIGRNHWDHRFTSELRPLAKSLAGAIRGQKILWVQSSTMIENCLLRLYKSSNDFSEILETLQLVYQRVNRRCINPDESPWKEAVTILECIASPEILDDNIPVQIDSVTAVIINDPIPKKCADETILRTDVTSRCASLHLKPIVADFANREPENDGGATARSILVAGPEGSGKTYLLNEVGAWIRENSTDVDVIHPSLPFDAIGSTVGAAEDILISLMCYAKTQNGRCIVLLDDIDIICGQTEDSLSKINTGTSSGNQEPHLTARLRLLFMSLLDVIQKRNYIGCHGHIMLICSAKENFGKGLHRFDRTLPLLPPNEEERNTIIAAYTGSDCSENELVECTLGFSRAEIAHHCQQSLLDLHSTRIGDDSIKTKSIENYIKEKLQSSVPESLKNGVNANFVDLNVFSARDLQRLYPIKNVEDPITDLPLFGESAKGAWQELRRLIVLPVCQGEALEKILHHQNSSSVGRKTFGGGVLLAAPPGTGKSSLAFFCGAFASYMNPSVKLIDVSCTSLIHKEVGGSERALHRLFQSARSATPCIVVMDGIENIAAVRGNDNTTEGTMDRLLSTLLTELDGVDSENTRSYVGGNFGSMTIIGITHNPSWIDPALRRPGRLERTIHLGNPDEAGREKIVLKEFENTVYQADEFYPHLKTLGDLASRVALETDGYTGAEVIAICNESKLQAFNNFLDANISAGKDYITPKLVLEASRTQRANS